MGRVNLVDRAVSISRIVFMGRVVPIVRISFVSTELLWAGWSPWAAFGQSSGQSVGDQPYWGWLLSQGAGLCGC